VTQCHVAIHVASHTPFAQVCAPFPMAKAFGGLPANTECVETQLTPPVGISQVGGGPTKLAYWCYAADQSLHHAAIGDKVVMYPHLASMISITPALCHSGLSKCSCGSEQCEQLPCVIGYAHEVPMPSQHHHHHSHSLPLVPHAPPALPPAYRPHHHRVPPRPRDHHRLPHPDQPPWAHWRGGVPPRCQGRAGPLHTPTEVGHQRGHS
jgi:hypothetical protein